MMELLKRLARYYPAEILLSVVMIYVALLSSYPEKLKVTLNNYLKIKRENELLRE